MSDFKDECISAVQRGASGDRLLEIVERHKYFGLTQVEAYCTLGDLRKELGCEECEETPVCEELEEIMDRIWGFCDAADQIWPEILSDDQLREFRSREHNA